MDSGRNHVVAGLTEIHVVVRMDQLAPSCPTQQFRRAIRNHLVRIHVRRGAGAGLKNIDGKFGVQFSVDDLGSRLLDRFGWFLVDQSQRVVDASGSPFDHSHGSNDRPRHPQRADWKVFDGPGGLNSIIGVCRNGQFPHRVALDPCSAGCRLPVCVFHTIGSISRVLTRCGRHDKLSPPASTRVSTMDSSHLTVDAYAGYKGEETPRSFTLDGRKLDVREVVDRWYSETHSYFRVHASDGQRYVLRSEEHTSELQSPVHLVCRLLLEKKK